MCLKKNNKTAAVNNSQSIRVYGTTWCGDCRRARLVFEKMNIPFEFIDIDKDNEGALFVTRTNRGSRSVPTIVFPDGSILVEPSNAQLEKKLTGFQGQD